MGRKAVEEFHIGYPFSFYICHPPTQDRVSHYNVWVDGPLVWPNRKTQTLDSGSGCPHHCIGNLSNFLRLAENSTAKGDIWFLSQQ